MSKLKPITAKQQQRLNVADTKTRTDAWANLLTGVGVKGIDRRADTTYRPTGRLSDGVLRDMYRGDGFARKIIDVPAKEMMRKGFTLVGDPDGFVNARFQETGINKSVLKMLKWSRLFGGGFGVLGLKDGREMSQPLNEPTLQSVEFMHVFDRYRVQWTSADLYNDPKDAKFGKPKFYTVSPIGVGQSFKVHESRTVMIDGLEVPDQDRQSNQGWGDTSLQPAFEHLRQFAAAYGGAEIIIEDFIQAVLSIKNLQDMLATPEGTELVKRRLDLMDISRHVLHIKLLDADAEQYKKEASSVAGLSDLMDRFGTALAGVTGIPATKLLGMAPAGLNATGESDIRNWYDDLSAEQEAILSPVYERLCYLVFISKAGGFKGKEPEGWTIKWNPLYELTAKEQAELYKATADGDAAYIGAGVLDPGTVHDQRFMGDGFGGIVDQDEAPEQTETGAAE
jgi:hypothetical protein